MNDEALAALRALCHKGRTPAAATLRMIEDYIIAQNRATWRTNRSSIQKITAEVLDQLGLTELVYVSFRNIPGFLLNPNKIAKVYLDKDKTKHIVYTLDDLAEAVDSGMVIKDGDEHYAAECQITWFEPVPQDERPQTRVPSFRHLYRDASALKWKAPPLGTCPECSRMFRKDHLIFNMRIGALVDQFCNDTINGHVNPQQNPAQPITAYHSHKVSWKFYAQRAGNERSMPMGVELEMQNKYLAAQDGANNAATQILLTLRDDNPQYYFETDSSLAGGGFEMITNPMTLEFGTAWWSRALPIIRKHCVGYGVEKYLGKAEMESMNYGIHITVPRSYVPDSVIVKIARFFDARDNYEFMGAIAQRGTIYGGYSLGVHSKPKASTSLSWNKETKGSLQNKDRRMPINIKPGLIEFRMFRSTLNQVSFLKNLEFIDAVTSYYKESLGVSYHHKDLILWVLKNYKRYPNLIKYLKHPVYFVKGVGTVKNTWLPLIKDIKIKVYDPYKEYGPMPLYLDTVDQQESSMVGA